VKQFIFILLTAFGYSVGFSQDTREVYKVNPGQSIEEAIKGEARFMYPEFKAGFVLFRNGNFGSSKMNYNFLHQELQFIDGADTLALDKAEDIRHVIIEKDTFYFRDKHWLRQVVSNGQVRMAELKSLSFANNEKIGAFGQVNSGSSIDAIENMVTISNITKKLEANQILTFAMSYNYYFSDKFDNYKLANRKSIVNLFGNKCKGLDQFLESEKVNYKNGSDMKKVFDYISANLRK
jgi:hypothetical protein